MIVWSLVVWMGGASGLFTVSGFTDEASCIAGKRQFVEQMHPKAAGCMNFRLGEEKR